ncbi:MAG: hypothetical protein M0R80_23360, partial [Proteobacteria bacterium]|nr:hypothetical protein [Pseudomonadota bacterium]
NRTSGAPFPTTLDTSSDVKWMEYECSPSGLTHYGTEWDWLDFYWNLWTEGSYKFTIPQIQNVWDNVPDSDIAYECCAMSSGTPTICAPRDMSAPCGTLPNLWPTQLTVGKLWDGDGDYDVTYGLIDKARSVYGDNMANNFESKGDAAGVNH